MMKSLRGRKNAGETACATNNLQTMVGQAFSLPMPFFIILLTR